MKTLVKSLLLALSLGLVTSVASVSEAKPVGRPTGVATYKAGMFTAIDGTLVVLVDKETGGHVDIQLKTIDGTVLYNQRLGKKDLKTRTKLNLSELADGQYTLEITNGVEKTTQNISIATRQPSTPSRIVSVK